MTKRKQQVSLEETLVSSAAGLTMSGDISESMRRRLIAQGDYPGPIVLSRNRHGRPIRVAWIASEIHAWVARRIAASRTKQDQPSTGAPTPAA